MTQHTHHQEGRVGQRTDTAQPRTDTNTLPALLTKKELASRMDCTMPGGLINRRRLYNCVLTDDVLERIGLTSEQVRKISFRTFTREQTVLLVEILSL